MKHLKNLSRIFLSVALLLLIPFQTAMPASDLWDIFQLALSNNSTYHAEELRHQAVLFDQLLEKSDFGLRVTSRAEIGKSLSDKSGSNRSEDNNRINLSLKKPLYNRVSNIEIKQSKSREQVSEFALKDARQDLIIRVAERYFNLLAALDRKEVARVEKIAIKKQLDLANERLQVGLGTKVDLFDAKARLKLAEAKEIQAQNQINIDISSLRQVIGETPQALVPLSESAPLEPPSPNSVEVWVERSQQANMSLIVQKLNVGISADEILRQKSALYPTLTVTGDYSLIDAGLTASHTHNSSTVTLQLSVPVYLSGGVVKVKTKQFGLRHNREESILEETRREVSAITTSAFLNVNSNISQAEALFEAITAGENALEAKEEGFNAGLTTNLDVLDAQRDLSRSKTDYLLARYNYILAVLALERAVGDLNEEDIRRVNEWLTEGQ